jgi:hypothetical protein
VGFFHSKVQTVLPKFLTHITRIPARTAIDSGIGQAGQERSHSNLSAIESGPFHLSQLSFGLCEHFFSSCYAIQLSCCGNITRPAHVGREYVVRGRGAGYIHGVHRVFQFSVGNCSQ